MNEAQLILAMEWQGFIIGCAIIIYAILRIAKRM
jgi:hypothetical protein